MKLVTILGTFLATLSLGAEPLESFKFELSCTRYGGGDTYTIMIHNDIEFDGKTGECKATKGRFISYKENYDIDFKCEKPIAITTGKRHPIFTWVFTAPEAGEKFSKLVVLLNHETQKGSGFALSENGTEISVDCKKW